MPAWALTVEPARHEKTSMNPFLWRSPGALRPYAQVRGAGRPRVPLGDLGDADSAVWISTMCSVTYRFALLRDLSVSDQNSPRICACTCDAQRRFEALLGSKPFKSHAAKWVGARPTSRVIERYSEHFDGLAYEEEVGLCTRTSTWKRLTCSRRTSTRI